jgi:hypothetical protein
MAAEVIQAWRLVVKTYAFVDGPSTQRSFSLYKEVPMVESSAAVPVMTGQPSL